MTVRPLALTAAMTLAVLLCERALTFASVQSKSTPVKAESEDTSTIAAPLYYKNVMLVAVNSEGVAAFVFGDRIENGTKYRYRYLKHGTDEEVSGEGSVFEKETNGKSDGGTLKLVAGDLSLKWSRGDTESGWIYYEPEKMRVQIADADRFEKESPLRIVGSRAPLPKISLKRFRNQP
jgi:hypothetical protein